jgi:hypothetical protein
MQVPPEAGSCVITASLIRQMLTCLFAAARMALFTQWARSRIVKHQFIDVPAYRHAVQQWIAERITV